MAEISSLSSQYVMAAVSFTDPVTGALLSPSADPVQFAFTTVLADPLGGDWVTASWRSGGPPYVAQCMVGPAGHVLGKGDYRVWVKITDSPEIPALRVGFLRVS